MTEVGYGSLAIIPSFQGFEAKLSQGSSKALIASGRSGGEKFGKATAEGARSKIKSMAKSVIAPLAGVFAVAKGVDFLKESVTQASDLNEAGTALAQTFGKKGLPAVQKFADQGAKTLGQSKLDVLNAAQAFGVYGKAAGLAQQKNAKFSTKLAGLATDLASFYNTTPQEATEALAAGLRGESEPLRRYGVLLNDASLKAEALSMGLLKPVKDQGKILGARARMIDAQKKYNDAIKEHGKNSLEALKAEGQLGYAQSSLKKATEGTVPTLTAQQKILAANALVFKQTKDAQGDFTRTSGGLANQQRILAAQLDDVKGKIGTALLPIVLTAVRAVNEKVMPAFDHWSDWFTKKGIPAISDFEKKAEPFVKGVLSDTRDVLKEAAPYAKSLADAFNSLPSDLKKGLGAAAVLGVGAKKLGLFSLLGSRKGKGFGGGSGILGMLSRNKPIPVIVVNKGGVPGVGGGDVPGTVGKTSGKAAEKEAETLTKKGLKGGKIWLPILTAVTLGELSNKYAPKVDPKGHETQAPIATWAVGKLKGAVDKRQVEETTQALIRQGGRWAKVNNMLDIGRSSADKLKAEVFDLGKKVDHVAGVKQTRFEAPDLLKLLNEARQYGSYLDGLDGRIIRTHIQSTISRNRLGPSEGGGRTNPRSPGVQINIDKVQAHDYKDFMGQMQRRTRQHALDGMP